MSEMLAREMTSFLVICIVCQVNGLPLISNSKDAGSVNKPSKFLDKVKSYHIFPHWVAELGEIAMIAIHYAWHHELTEHIQEVGFEVSEVNSKLDAILATSPAASQLFSQLKKSSHHSPHQVNQNQIRHHPSPGPPTIQQEIIRWKKIIADDN